MFGNTSLISSFNSRFLDSMSAGGLPTNYCRWYLHVFVKRLCNNLPLYTTSPGLPYASHNITETGNNTPNNIVDKCIQMVYMDYPLFNPEL